MITLGLDVGGTKVLGVALDPSDPARILAEARLPTPIGGEGLPDTLLELADVLSGDLSGSEVAAIGVGVPGLVDRTGMLHLGAHLSRIADLPLEAILRERTGLPAVVDNDANCHAVAEQRAGAAAGSVEAVMITLGTGIGTGIISTGRLVQGTNGFAGEAGHMVVDPTGPPCPCGRRGCWERFASGSGLGRLARDAALGGRLSVAVTLAGGDADDVRGEHVTVAARQGDPECLAVLDDFAWWIGLGLANVVNLLDPAKIVIGGGLVEAADLLLEPVQRHLDRLVMGAGERPPVPVVAAELGEQAGAIGAALLASSLAAAPGG